MPYIEKLHRMRSRFPQKFRCAGMRTISPPTQRGRPDSGRNLTKMKQRAKFIISTAASEDSALTLCLHQGKQDRHSRILNDRCAKALNVLSANPKLGEEGSYWNAVYDVVQKLQEAVKAAGTVSAKFFWAQLCDSDEIDKRVETIKGPMQALYRHATQLFWEMMIKDIIIIKLASQKNSGSSLKGAVSSF